MISILISYLLLIFSIHSHLVVSKKEFKNQDVWMILTYALATFFFIVAFAAGWKFFFDFKIGDEIYSPSRSTAVDALYFSFVVFSTLGFGDVLPGNGMAKIFIMLQLFVSSIHNVSFLTLLMLKRKG